MSVSQTGSGRALMTLHRVSKRFEHRADLASRIAARLGARSAPTALRALSDIDLTIAPGEVVGLVGESGCGKSTLGRIVAGVLEPTAGEVRYDAPDADASGAKMKRARALAVQMIFQNPMASLNPRQRVDELIGEAARVHGLVRRAEFADWVALWMRKVGLDPAWAARYPHELSGGQRQRVGIARALALNPRLIVCDEAVAALDVSVQAQVLNLFIDLRTEFGLAYLFISHNLGVVGHLSDRVVIMYLGRIVESAPSARIFEQPAHPYTQALIAELPSFDSKRRRYQPIRGELPSPLAPPPGCAFHPRCPHAIAPCRVDLPALAEIATGHFSACHLNHRETGAAVPRAGDHHGGQ